jgi:hypothetical protein
MTWGLLAVLGLGLFLTYVIWQETRSHLRWRDLVQDGNVWAIRQLVTAEIARWHEMRPPHGVSAALWAGVQTAELVAIGRDHIQLACVTESEYRMAEGRREQVTTALEAAMRLAAKLVEMVLYDIPEVKVDRVRVDVYSTFGSGEGVVEQRCILSTTGGRAAANGIDWETTPARAIIESLDSRFDVDNAGKVRAIVPDHALPDEPGEASMPEEARNARPPRQRRRRQ